jgi:hypothetical protein
VSASALETAHFISFYPISRIMLWSVEKWTLVGAESGEIEKRNPEPC